MRQWIGWMHREGVLTFVGGLKPIGRPPNFQRLVVSECPEGYVAVLLSREEVEYLHSTHWDEATSLRIREATTAALRAGNDPVTIEEAPDAR